MGVIEQAIPHEEQLSGKDYLAMRLKPLSDRIAAIESGYDTSFKFLLNLKPYNPDQDRYTPFLKVTFSREKIEIADTGLLQAMKDRKMVRAISNPLEKLPPELIEKMAKVILQKYPGLHLNILADKSSLLVKKTRAAIAFAQQGAMTVVINDDNFASELGDYLVPDDDPSDFKMRPREFGLGYESGVNLHRGLKAEIPLSPIHKQGFPNTERQIVESASAIVIIQAKDDTPMQRLLTGQAVEDLTLLLTLHKWNTSMHAATTEVEIGNKPLRTALMLVNRKDYGRPTALFAVGRPLKAEDANRKHAARPVIEKLIFSRSA